jgi:hypothetical protein
MSGIPPFLYLDITAGATTQGGSIPLWPDSVNKVSVSASWGVNTGTWKVEFSDDPRADDNHPDHANAVWHDKTAALGLTNPAGGASSDEKSMDNANYGYMQILYTKGAGTAAIKVHVTGHSTE